MQTTFQQLLDTLRDQAGSDRKAAQLLGITQGAFSAWRARGVYPDDDQALKIAAALKLSAAHVLAIVRADRTSSRDARRVWLQIAEQFKDAAVVAAFAIGTGMIAAPSAPANSTIGGHAQLEALCKKPRKFRFPSAAMGLA